MSVKLKYKNIRKKSNLFFNMLNRYLLKLINDNITNKVFLNYNILDKFG